MNKIYGEGQLTPAAEKFNSSLQTDKRLVFQDIRGSIAHATALSKCGVISSKDASAIKKTLKDIETELKAGTLEIDQNAEDIHSFIEAELTKRLGDAGKKVHTGRSRNDQVAVDLRLWALDAAEAVSQRLLGVIKALTDKAEKEAGTIMCGYTHLQRAQPVTFGHHLLAYANMFMRDYGRLQDAKKRMSVNPLGSGALAGAAYNIDRQITTDLLGFTTISTNSMDAVSDRDFAIELVSVFSLIMMHLSRLSDEIIMWASAEFCYITLSPQYSTGSSIMPQKRNPDIAELTRAKTGGVYGKLFELLTVMKGLPLAYNKDLQETKQPLIDASDTVSACLELFPGMIKTAKVNRKKMLQDAKKGLLEATDAADYLALKGVPFRDAYGYVKQLVEKCLKGKKTLDKLPLEEYKTVCGKFGADIYEFLSLENCVNRRNIEGGTSAESVARQMSAIRQWLKSNT